VEMRIENKLKSIKLKNIFKYVPIDAIMFLFKSIFKYVSIQILYSNIFPLKYVELVNGSSVVIIPAKGGCSTANR
jgi:hypothetical protein